MLVYEYKLSETKQQYAAADRAWFAISRFYENCKTKKPGKKGYPRFQKDNRSVEYKTTGWKRDRERWSPYHMLERNRPGY